MCVCFAKAEASGGGYHNEDGTPNLYTSWWEDTESIEGQDTAVMSNTEIRSTVKK